MKKREKILLIVTLILGGIFVGWGLLPEELSFSDLATGELETQRQRFKNNRAWLGKIDEIQEQLEAVRTVFPETVAGRSPEATFSDELTKMLKERGVARPDVKPPLKSEIEDVDDYYFIDLELNINGTMKEMVDLLLDFRQAGLLIKAFEMRKPNPDHDFVQLKVIVSRLAKLQEGEDLEGRPRRRPSV